MAKEDMIPERELEVNLDGKSMFSIDMHAVSSQILGGGGGGGG